MTVRPGWMPLGRFSRCGEHAVGRATMEPAGKKGFVALGTQVHNLPRWLPPFPPLTPVWKRPPKRYQPSSTLPPSAPSYH